MKHLNQYIQEKLQATDVYEIICSLGNVGPADSYRQKIIKKWIDDNKVKKVQCISEFDLKDVNSVGITVINPIYQGLIKKDKDKVKKLYDEAHDSGEFHYDMFGKDTSIYVGPDIFFIKYENNPVRNWGKSEYILAIIKTK